MWWLLFLCLVQGAGTVRIDESEWGTALVGSPNYYFFTNDQPVTLAFVDLLSNPAFSITVTPLPGSNSTTTTITEKEYDQLLFGLVIGLGSALVITPFVSIWLYKAWAHSYDQLNT